MRKIYGWIKLHRSLLENDLWLACNDFQKVLIIRLLLMANHKPQKIELGVEIFELKPGQFITSREKLIQQCGNSASEQKIRTALKKFEKYNFLTLKSTNKFTVVNIVNWGFYQQLDEKNNQQITNKQPTNNQQITTNKNDKNDNNDNNIYIVGQNDPPQTFIQDSKGTSRQQGMDNPIQDSKGTSRESVENSKVFIVPSVAEVQAYCYERGNGIDAENFVDFYKSNGWKVGKNKMQDWKAVVRRWEKNEQNKHSLNKNKFINYLQPDCSREMMEEIIKNKAKKREL